MKPGTVLVRNGTLITLGERNRIIEKGSVLIRDGVIAGVGRGVGRVAGATVIDARGRIVMPGFINAHTHLYSAFARGLAPKKPPGDFVEILENLWWPLDRALNAQDLWYSALIGLLDCIRSGTTTIIDHHESQGHQAGSLDVLARAFRRIGLRGCLCLGVSDRHGRGAEGLAESVRFLERVRGAADDRVCGMLGLHALFTVGSATLANVVAAAKDLGCGIHAHIAEDKADQVHSRKRYGQSVVERLDQAGGLGPGTLAAHCVHVSRAEIGRLAAAGAMVVHNPQSNMNNAVGVAPVPALLRAGVTVGLGTDGMTADMRDEVRAAHLLQKHHLKDPAAFLAESCALLLQNNARIASRLFGRPLGVLASGAGGDAVIVDYDPPTPLSIRTFAGHFLFGICGARVTTTIVGGSVLMHNGGICGMDAERIAALARRQARSFWRRF